METENSVMSGKILEKKRKKLFVGLPEALHASQQYFSPSETLPPNLWSFNRTRDKLCYIPSVYLRCDGEGGPNILSRMDTLTENQILSEKNRGLHVSYKNCWGLGC